MSNQQNDAFWENWFENAPNINEISQQAKDHLFSANHRNQMLQKYGYTEAQRIKIEDLCWA